MTIFQDSFTERPRNGNKFIITNVGVSSPIHRIKVQQAAGISYENVYLAIVHVTKKYYV